MSSGNRKWHKMESWKYRREWEECKYRKVSPEASATRANSLQQWTAVGSGEALLWRANTEYRCGSRTTGLEYSRWQPATARSPVIVCLEEASEFTLHPAVLCWGIGWWLRFHSPSTQPLWWLQGPPIFLAITRPAKPLHRAPRSRSGCPTPRPNLASEYKERDGFVDKTDSGPRPYLIYGGVCTFTILQIPWNQRE